MKARTQKRLTSSISLRTAVFALFLIAAAPVLDLVVDVGSVVGVWSGIIGLVGVYVLFLSLTIFGAIEFLRYIGY